MCSKKTLFLVFYVAVNHFNNSKVRSRTIANVTNGGASHSMLIPPLNIVLNLIKLSEHDWKHQNLNFAIFIPGFEEVLTDRVP